MSHNIILRPDVAQLVQYLIANTYLCGRSSLSLVVARVFIYCLSQRCFLKTVGCFVEGQRDLHIFGDNNGKKSRY